MGIVEIFAAIKSISKIAEVLEKILDTLVSLRHEAIQKELSVIRREYDESLSRVVNADSKEERRRLALELAQRGSK